MISHSQVECLIEIIYWKKISHFQVLYIIIFYSPFYLRPSCCLKRNVWNLITTRRKKVRRKLLFGLYPKLLCSDDDSLSCHGPIQLHVESQSRLFDRGVNKKGRNWSLSKLKNLFTRVVIRLLKSDSADTIHEFEYEQGVPMARPLDLLSTGNRRGVRLDDRISWWTLVRICRRLICNERIAPFPLSSLFKFTDQREDNGRFLIVLCTVDATTDNRLLDER